MMRLLQRFRADRNGSIAIMGAGFMMMLMCCAALGVDVASIYVDHRKAQTAADIAAIVAASNLANAIQAAQDAVVDNGYQAGALTAVELGTYTPSAALAPNARFVTPATGVANAVRVTLQTQTPLIFGRIFTGTDHFNIVTKATAASTAMASFAIGSSLASLNGGVLNALLGGLLGTSLSLSVMDYQGLANAQIDLPSFLSALATRVGVSAGTYNNLLSTSVKIGDVVNAMASTQPATSALSKVAQALAGVTTMVVPSQIFNLGAYGNLPIGQQPAVGVSVSALDLLHATAAAGGANQLQTGFNFTLPGLASVTFNASVGEQPPGVSWVTIGSQGASVHTAQTRILLQVKLIGTGSISLVNLPIYIEVASGTATLNALSCGFPDVSTSSVQLGVTPGILDAWIANVSPADLYNFTTAPNPGPATLVNLGLIQVTARAHIGMGNTAPSPVNFSYSDIQSQTRKTVNTTDFLSSLIGSLLGGLNLTVSIGPLGLPIPGLPSVVTGIISAVVSPLDDLVSGALSVLGIGIGQATVWVTGIRCDHAVLVN